MSPSDLHCPMVACDFLVYVLPPSKKNHCTFTMNTHTHTQKSMQISVLVLTIELYDYLNNIYWQIFETSITVDCSGVLNKILLIFALFGHLQVIKHFV